MGVQLVQDLAALQPALGEPSLGPGRSPLDQRAKRGCDMVGYGLVETFQLMAQTSPNRC